MSDTSLTPSVLRADELGRALAVRDLTDHSAGPHAIQLLIDAVVRAVAAQWACEVRVCRSHPVVPVDDNYDRLGYSSDAVARDARYTRYVSETCVLRSHTTAMVPPELRRLARDPAPDVALVCPGIVYRRDSIDRLHTGTPHQLDVWRVVDSGRRPMTEADLVHMIDVVAGALLPGARHRAEPRAHPYTDSGRQVDVLVGDEWVEILECGVAAPSTLAAAGVDPQRYSGLAMGVGLDRVLMVRKGIPDIRLLRSSDPRVAQQMLDLEPYRPVSAQPPIPRDMSIAVAGDADGEVLGDRVRDALGDDAASVETVEVVSETPAADLPSDAAARLGIAPDQKNVLLRVVLRNLERSLTRLEANVLRDRIYAALHEGSAHQWASAEASGPS